MLGKYKEGAKEFETCIKEFPNRKDTKTVNRYLSLAFYQWGHCEQARGEYEGALKLFSKFLDKKPDPKTFSLAEVYANIAICQMKLGRISESTVTINKVIPNFDQLQNYEKYVVAAAVFEMAPAWIAKLARNLSLVRFQSQ